MNKEAFLALRDGVAHTQDGVKALLNIFDHPSRFLQTLLQPCVAIALTAFQGVGINVIHLQAWHHLGIKHGAKLRQALLVHAVRQDQHIGDDDVALDINEAPARLGLQACNQCHGQLHLHFSVIHGQGQTLEIALGQQLKRLFANRQRTCT